MARLILDTNTVVYNNKYYRQMRGGAMGSAFTQVLANIYMYEWEQDLITHQAQYNEIYGRYVINEFSQLFFLVIVSLSFFFFAQIDILMIYS